MTALVVLWRGARDLGPGGAGGGEAADPRRPASRCGSTTTTCGRCCARRARCCAHNGRYLRLSLLPLVCTAAAAGAGHRAAPGVVRLHRPRRRQPGAGQRRPGGRRRAAGLGRSTAPGAARERPGALLPEPAPARLARRAHRGRARTCCSCGVNGVDVREDAASSATAWPAVRRCGHGPSLRRSCSSRRSRRCTPAAPSTAIRVPYPERSLRVFGLRDALARVVPGRVVRVRARAPEAAWRGDLAGLGARGSGLGARLAALVPRYEEPRHCSRCLRYNSPRMSGCRSRAGAVARLSALLGGALGARRRGCRRGLRGDAAQRPAWSPSTRCAPIASAATATQGAQTPVLDALAARGARFAAATTTTPLTLSAHTSLFTGTWPTTHGVRDNTGFYVRRRRADAGRDVEGAAATAPADSSARSCSTRAGASPRASTPTSTTSTCPRTSARASTPSSGRGGEVVDQALAWLGQPGAQPFFAWVHLYDPHSPYDAPAEFASRFPATRDGAYDAEIAYTDAQVGRLLAALDAAGRRRRHAGRGPRRPRRAARRAPRAVARVLRLRRLGADSADHRRARASRRGSCPTRCASSTSCRRCSTWSAWRCRRRCRARRCGRRSTASGRSCWRSRRPGIRASTTAGASCRRCATGAFKFILAPTRELYDVAKDPGELTNLAASDQAPRRPDGAGPAGPRVADHAGRRRQGPAGGRPGRRAAAARARLRRLDLGDEPRGPPAPRPEGHHRALQPAAAGRLGLRGRALRRGRRQGAEGAGRRSGHHRGPLAARQHLHQGRDGTPTRSRPISGRSPSIRRTCSRPTTSRWPTAPPARSTKRSSASSARSSSIRAAAGRTSSSATSTCSAASRPRRSRC